MKKKHEGEHENSERWLLTYADLITLLLGLFVILYAGSQVDMTKFKQLMAAFGGIFEGSAGVVEGGAGIAPDGAPLRPPVEKPQDALRGEVQSAIQDAIAQGRISLTETDRGLTVHVAEKLLFDPGRAELRAEALPVLESLSRTLEKMPNEIRVEGHTDDTPIRTAQFPDNWHLSVSRALNVGLSLLDKGALRPERLAIVGYGEFRPIAPNDTDADKARNRRVDIVIVK